MFIIRRFIQDFNSWEKSNSESYMSSMTSTNDLVTYLTSDLNTEETQKEMRRELEMWMDVTLEEMVSCFRKHKLEAKQLLLFLKENHDRYFERAHLVKCSEKHVMGTFPIDDGIDGGTSYCPYCEKDVAVPNKLHQQVVYNWKA